MSDIRSMPYRPDKDHCCEACVFGRGEHAEWCGRRPFRMRCRDASCTRLAATNETGLCEQHRKFYAAINTIRSMRA